jgi:hypothetical protein
LKTCGGILLKNMRWADGYTRQPTAQNYHFGVVSAIQLKRRQTVELHQVFTSFRGSFFLCSIDCTTVGASLPFFPRRKMKANASCVMTMEENDTPTNSCLYSHVMIGNCSLKERYAWWRRRESKRTWRAEELYVQMTPLLYAPALNGSSYTTSSSADATTGFVLALVTGASGLCWPRRHRRRVGVHAWRRVSHFFLHYVNYFRFIKKYVEPLEQTPNNSLELPFYYPWSNLNERKHPLFMSEIHRTGWRYHCTKFWRIFVGHSPCFP